MPPKHQRAAPVEMHDEEEEEAMEMGNMMDLHKYLDPDFSKNFMAGLPEKIRQRAQVLSAYDEDYLALQKSYKEKEMEIGRRFDALFAPILERRKEIIAGAPVSDEEIKAGMPEEHVGQVSLEAEGNDANADAAEGTPGLPGFWLRVLHHHTVIDSSIESHDEDVLKKLVDIRSSVADGEFGSFQVVFTFSPNDFFEETEITATVCVKEGKSEVTVSPITWKPGRNVMMHTVTKKQRAKRTGQVRTISHEEPQPSFFWLFSSKAAAGGKEEDKEEEEEENEEDEKEQRVGMLEILHTCIVPNAVRYYTGQAPDGFSDCDDDEEDEEEEEEEEEDIMPRGRGANRGGRGGRRGF